MPRMWRAAPRRGIGPSAEAGHREGTGQAHLCAKPKTRSKSSQTGRPDTGPNRMPERRTLDDRKGDLLDNSGYARRIFRYRFVAWTTDRASEVVR